VFLTVPRGRCTLVTTEYPTTCNPFSLQVPDLEAQKPLKAACYCNSHGSSRVPGARRCCLWHILHSYRYMQRTTHQLKRSIQRLGALSLPCHRIPQKNVTSKSRSPSTVHQYLLGQTDYNTDVQQRALREMSCSRRRDPFTTQQRPQMFARAHRPPLRQ
jgi:hypothetical protein